MALCALAAASTPYVLPPLALAAFLRMALLATRCGCRRCSLLPPRSSLTACLTTVPPAAPLSGDTFPAFSPPASARVPSAFYTRLLRLHYALRARYCIDHAFCVFLIVNIVGYRLLTPGQYVADRIRTLGAFCLAPHCTFGTDGQFSVIRISRPTLLRFRYAAPLPITAPPHTTRWAAFLPALTAQQHCRQPPC